jgi:hypothetical protein
MAYMQARDGALLLIAACGLLQKSAYACFCLTRWRIVGCCLRVIAILPAAA